MTQPDSSPETAAASQVLAGAPSGGARARKLPMADRSALFSVSLPLFDRFSPQHPRAPRAVFGRGVVVFAPGRRGRAAHQP
jgi:hypothetical protein